MRTPPDSIVKKGWVYFLCTLMLFHTLSCTYFQTTIVSRGFEKSINDIGEIYRHFIVHDGDAMYGLNSIKVDSTNISGNLTALTEDVFYTKQRSERYAKHEKEIINEVHIYLQRNAEPLQFGEVTIPLSDITELRIIDQDSGRTTASFVLGTIGVVLGSLAVLTIIAALLKSSCPYVYVNNGEAYIFTGETFGGAIGENLARDDYMPLPAIKVVDGSYQLLISNELKERQYTDVAELILVNHPEEQRVLLDKNGQVQVIGELQSPVEVYSYAGENLSSVLAASDNDVYLFNEEDYSENGLVVNFKKPANADVGKLVLKGKNSLWFDYLFGEFLQKFGSTHDAFMAKQSEISSAERMQRILDNNFPLSIYAKQNGEWQLVDYLLTVGPLAAREFVVPIDMAKFPGEDLEIKIETGFMFWELDQLAMDFTENTVLETFHLQALTAFGTGQKDWTAALEKADGQYMAQEIAGEVTELRFAVPPVADGQIQSAFLHTRGYYELIREFTGPPQLSELNKFRDPAYFSAFSRTGYLQVLDKEEDVENLVQVAD